MLSRRPLHRAEAKALLQSMPEEATHIRAAECDAAEAAETDCCKDCYRAFGPRCFTSEGIALLLSTRYSRGPQFLNSEGVALLQSTLYSRIV